MYAIEIRDLCKQYRDFRLDHLSLTLPSGSILGLVGENGAGKSTTIGLLMNFIRRDSGSVRVLGVDNQDKAFGPLREQIGVVLDEAYFPEVISPRNVNVILRNTYRNWDEERFFSYLKKFDLPERKIFRDFSRGMKMKLALAVALSHHAKLLILDEATSGLDPMARDELLDLFNEFTREEDHSILISSHIVSDLEKICDYIAFLHRGRLVLCEEKDRLLEEYALVRMPARDFEAVPPEAVRGKKTGPYGVEALVLKSRISAAIPTEHTNLEDIILFLAKEGERG